MKKGELDGTEPESRIRRKLFWDTLTHGGCSFGGALVPIIPFMIPFLDSWTATVPIDICTIHTGAGSFTSDDNQAVPSDSAESIRF